MKSIITVLTAIAISAIIFSAAYASEHRGTVKERLYTVKEINKQDKEHKISGKLPCFTGVNDKVLEEKLNKTINEFYDKIILSAGKEDYKNKRIDFSYSILSNEKYLSVVMHGSVFRGNTGSDDVETIVLDRNIYKIYTLKDLLGSKAYEKAQEHIRLKMSENPELYLEDANPVVDGKTSFYVDNDSRLVIIFNKYQITPGVQGCPKFVMELKK